MQFPSPMHLFVMGSFLQIDEISSSVSFSSCNSFISKVSHTKFGSFNCAEELDLIRIHFQMYFVS